MKEMKALKKNVVMIFHHQIKVVGVMNLMKIYRMSLKVIQKNKQEKIEIKK
jgi:hypothetical protein